MILIIINYLKFVWSIAWRTVSVAGGQANYNLNFI